MISHAEELLKNCKIKKSTLRNYQTSLNLGTKRGIRYEMPEEQIINLLENMQTEYKTNTIKNVLNVMIVLKKCAGVECPMLIKYRNRLNEGQLYAVSDANIRLLDKDPYKKLKGEILNYTEELFQEKKYKDFIINYLIVNFSVRNQDLFLEIITDYEDIDPSKNYLLINNNRTITYIRNFYKTVDTYGPKEHLITNNNFYTACVESTGQNLLSSKFENIGSEIRKSTYQGLGESAYFKLFVRDASSINEVKKFVDNRGTQFETIYDFYNLDK